MTVRKTINAQIVMDLGPIKEIQQSLADSISSDMNGYSYESVVAYLLKLGLQEYQRGRRLE